MGWGDTQFRWYGVEPAALPEPAQRRFLGKASLRIRDASLNLTGSAILASSSGEFKLIKGGGARFAVPTPARGAHPSLPASFPGSRSALPGSGCALLEDETPGSAGTAPSTEAGLPSSSPQLVKPGGIVPAVWWAPLAETASRHRRKPWKGAVLPAPPHRGRSWLGSVLGFGLVCWFLIIPMGA